MELAQGKKKKKEDKKKKMSDGASPTTAATAVSEGEEVTSAAEGHLKAEVEDETGTQSVGVTADRVKCLVTLWHILCFDVDKQEEHSCNLVCFFHVPLGVCHPCTSGSATPAPRGLPTLQPLPFPASCLWAPSSLQTHPLPMSLI